MIEVFQLSKSYGDLHAVSELTFQIGKGEVVGLLGLNGAGKTTTMRMLTTYLPPSSGTAKIAGFDIRTQADDVRRSIGYLPETPPLYPELRVREYLTFVAKIKGVTRSEVRSRVEETMERCALAKARDRLCGQLSKGYRQRVGIAQALVHKPPVIILDEPTSGLDPAQIIEIRQLIAELRHEHTVILSTHILQEVSQICSNVIIIAGGKLVTHGPLTELTREKSLEQRFLEAVTAEGSTEPAKSVNAA